MWISLLGKRRLVSDLGSKTMRRRVSYSHVVSKGSCSKPDQRSVPIARDVAGARMGRRYESGPKNDTRPLCWSGAVLRAQRLSVVLNDEVRRSIVQAFRQRALRSRKIFKAVELSRMVVFCHGTGIPVDHGRRSHVTWLDRAVATILGSVCRRRGCRD